MFDHLSVQIYPIFDHLVHLDRRTLFIFPFKTPLSPAAPPVSLARDPPYTPYLTIWSISIAGLSSSLHLPYQDPPLPRRSSFPRSLATLPFAHGKRPRCRIPYLHRCLKSDTCWFVFPPSLPRKLGKGGEARGKGQLNRVAKAGRAGPGRARSMPTPGPAPACPRGAAPRPAAEPSLPARTCRQSVDDFCSIGSGCDMMRLGHAKIPFRG